MPIVLVTGAAPYLGGPQTWLPLRAAMPEHAFEEIDLLQLADAPDMAAACRSAIARDLGGAAAIVAHWSAARVAIEAVAQTNPTIPVILLSPFLVVRRRLSMRVLRAFFRTAPGGAMLRRIALSKMERLSRDREFVREQLRLFVSEGALREPLVDEAVVRVRDPRTHALARRTGQAFIEQTEFLDPRADRTVTNRTVLLGDGTLDRRMALRIPGAHVVPGVHAAAMLDAPGAVAQALKAAIGYA